MEHSSPAPYLVNGIRHLLDSVKTESAPMSSGLNGVICGETKLIGFHKNRVHYTGQDVEDLCDEGSFEAVMLLLMNGESTNLEELADCSSLLSDAAVIDQPVADTIATMPLQTRPLDLFPLSISLLSCFDPTPFDRTLAASRSQFWRVMAQLPVLFHVAFGGRIQDGRAFSAANSASMSYAGRLLQILRDDNSAPTPEEEHAMNVVLICECITDMRPACFLARSFGSTVNDTVAGLKAASAMFVSQLRNDPFAWSGELLRGFRSADHAEKWWLSRTPRTMPFGFLSERPELRTKILQAQCRELLDSVPAMVMETSATNLEALLTKEQLYPTTDWAAARVLTLLRVPEDRVSLAIGIARLVGWAAQTIEQHTSGIPLLPGLRYAGDE
jgi:citrate synthase